MFSQLSSIINLQRPDGVQIMPDGCIGMKKKLYFHLLVAHLILPLCLQ
jgi:hypothetical protein